MGLGQPVFTIELKARPIRGPTLPKPFTHAQRSLFSVRPVLQKFVDLAIEQLNDDGVKWEVATYRARERGIRNKEWLRDRARKNLEAAQNSYAQLSRELIDQQHHAAASLKRLEAANVYHRILSSLESYCQLSTDPWYDYELGYIKDSDRQREAGPSGTD